MAASAQRGMLPRSPRAGLIAYLALTFTLACGAALCPFLISSGELPRASLRFLGFTLTCVLLGALLGWLRIASKSIGPTVTANTVLTAAAGLPFLLQ